MAVRNIQFDDGTIGVKEIMFVCEELTCYQRIKVSVLFALRSSVIRSSINDIFPPCFQVESGPPAQVKILHLNLSQVSYFEDHFFSVVWSRMFPIVGNDRIPFLKGSWFFLF